MNPQYYQIGKWNWYPNKVSCWHCIEIIPKWMILIFKKGMSQSCFLSIKMWKFAFRINHSKRIRLMCLKFWRYQIVSACSRQSDWFVSTFQKYFLIQENPAGLPDSGAIVRGPKGAVSLPTEPHRLSHHCRHC